jgi:DNA-binding MarR family transcriptional regulator
VSRRRATRPPLARLFAIAFRSQIDGLHDGLRARGWTDVRPSFGFVLLAARDRPTTCTELAGLLGVTKQAASKLVDTMEDAGYITRTANDDDNRQRLVALTRRGTGLLVVVEEIYAAMEKEWAKLIGSAELEGMRKNLVTVLAQTNGGQLPQVRPTW